MCTDFYSKYIIKEKIGEGTFSDVLKCQKISSGQYLAVKRLKKLYKHHSEALDSPEIVVLEKLPSHVNVLPLLEYIYDPTESKMFMVFELMEMSLYDLIQSRKRCLPESRVKHLFYQILKGLDHLHTNGIFHRDIKPENILLKKTVVKLADLGSVRGIYSQQPYTEYISTRWYRAPECILTTGNYGPKMDIWACGCVYFELLTSKPLFPGANEIDQLTRIHQVTGTPTFRVMTKMRRNQCRVGDIRFAAFPSMNLAVILPFTSDGGRDILKRMLVYDPDVRANVRRLLEHRYFNDLRETEYLAKQHNLSQSRTSKQWSNSLLFDKVNISKNTKLKPKLKEVTTNEKKNTDHKLTTNSWAPSSNTSKVNLPPRKSKPTNQPSPRKKRPGVVQEKSTVKKCLSVKPEAKQLINSDLKQPVKQHRGKACTLGNLAAINSKMESMKASKSQVSKPTYTTFTQRFLPPIPEH